ncbi:MAG TPA: discoidin domain-containing protein [Polyangiaceae bacterium]|nr:discoidin domain-containing protein [Polyangiaceae bacterium]
MACKVYTEDLLGSSGSGGSGTANGGSPSGGMSNGGSNAGTNARGGSGGSPSSGGGGSTAQGGGGNSGSTSGSGGEPPSGVDGGAGGVDETGAGGAAGSGATSSDGGAGGNGSEQQPLCSDHPLTARASWVPTASHDNAGKSLASNLIDNTTTRWTTGKPQSGDEWLQIDFTTTVSLTQINLQQSDTYGNDYPRTFNVIVSDTPGDVSGTVRASGSGQAGVTTTITLPGLTTGRYLLIKQLGSSLSWWSALEIEVSCVD